MSENEIKMSSYLDVNAVIEDCKKVSICDVVNEAILNSIQANATDIKVKFTTTKKENDLFKSIKSIEIVDNGEGFNDKNIQHFSTLYTKNKQEKGCKGYGRVYYKKAFEIVEICSFNSDKNDEKVDFVFTNDDFTKTDDIKLHTHTHKDNETSLLLEIPIVDNITDKDVSYDKKRIYNEIFNVIYPYIFLQENKNITISFYVNGKQECEDKKNEKEKDVPLIINLDKIKDIDNEPIVLDKQNSLFFDSKQEINLWYKITKREFEKEKATITTAICHNNRPLFESSFDKQPLQIDINIIGYDVLFLLESKWINNQQTDKDHHIKLDDKNKDKWNEIKKKVEDAINEILCNNIADLKEYNKENKKKFIKKYPEYAGFACEEKETGYFNEGKVLKQARKYRDELEDKVANDKGKNKKEKEANVREAIYYDLKSYFKHRENILNQFNELKDTKIEGQIHNLLFPQYLSRDEKEKFENNKKSGDKNQMTSRDYNKEFCDKIEFGYNNLWMIDDRFMGYSYIASEQYISTFIKNNNLQKVKGNGEMDIVVYFDNEDKKRAVIVECKKMTANYKENGTGISQLFKYAKCLHQCGIDEIYLLLPVNIDDDFRDVLENKEKFCKIFSHKGELWQNSYNDRNAYIQVITPDALIANAQARNKKFIEMANEEYEKQIDEQYEDDDNSNK